MSAKKVLNRIQIGLEDLLVSSSTDTVKQNRNGKLYEVTNINAYTLPYSGEYNIKDKIDSNYTILSDDTLEKYNTLDTKIDNNYGLTDNKINSNYNTLDTKIDSNLSLLSVSAGFNVDGAYVPNTYSNYLGDATSLTSADNKLDNKLREIELIYSDVESLIAGNPPVSSYPLTDENIVSLGRIVGDTTLTGDLYLYEDDSIFAYGGNIQVEDTLTIEGELRII